MSNYLSNFISRFQVGNLGIASTNLSHETESGGPNFSFVTAFNPSWASDEDESLDGARKQILFFLTPKKNSATNSHNTNVETVATEAIGSQEQVHLVGLLRGSYSLVQDFGKLEGPVTITLSNQTIVVVELEPGFFLACCCRTVSGSLASSETIGLSQTEALIKQCHQRFQLFNSSFELLIGLYGREQFCEFLLDHWQNFIDAVNRGSQIPYGPRTLTWPTRMNAHGALFFLQDSICRKSSIRLSEPCRSEMEDIVKCSASPVTGWTIHKFNSAAAKENGLLYQSSSGRVQLQQEYINCIGEYLQLLASNNCLTSQYLLLKDQLVLYFDAMYKEYDEKTEDGVQSDSDGDVEENVSVSAFGVTPSAALGLLHPVALTNSLVVLPLNSTVNQFRNLGLAVSDGIVSAPDWLTPWRSHEPLTSVGSRGSVESQQSLSHTFRGSYLAGLVDQDISNFLVYIPTIVDGKTEWREYILLVYAFGEYVVTLIYDSGLEELADPLFYSELEESTLIPLLKLAIEGELSTGFDMSASIGSLPGPIGDALKNNKKSMQATDPQTSSADIDSDFFYIIFEPEKAWYQTSLPDLASVNEHNPSLLRAIFHLHNQLAGQLFVKDHDKTMFTTGISDEHLHKFASSKSNDWLFYTMKYKGKVIVIIRNYNHRAKSKATLEPANSYLTQVADRVYGAANLGFLDNLGSDVKGWLGRLSSQEETD